MTKAVPELVREYTKKLSVPFMLLSLASLGLVALAPLLSRVTGAAGQPTLAQMIIVGVGMILTSSVFLAYASRVIGLKASWWLTASVFLSLFVAIQFIVGPSLLYNNQPYHLDSSLFSFDPNTSGGYVWAALLIFTIYSIVLAVTLKYCRVKYNLGIKTVRQRANTGKAILVVVLVFIVLAILNPGIVIFLPILLFASSSGYLGYILQSGGVFVLFAGVLSVLSAAQYLANSGELPNTKIKKGAVVAIAFWIGISLLFVYSTLWVVYMTILINIWPLKTISPSGK